MYMKMSEKYKSPGWRVAAINEVMKRSLAKKSIGIAIGLAEEIKRRRRE